MKSWIKYHGLMRLINNTTNSKQREGLKIMNKPSNYVSAGLETIFNDLTLACEKYPERFNVKSISSFLQDNVNKFLISFGTCFSKLPEDKEKRKKILLKGRINDNVIEKFSNILSEFRKNDILNGCNIYVDSGAYSIQVGYFDRSEMEPLIDIYNKFLLNKSDLFNYAFLLDMAPGSSICIYKSAEDMIKLGDLSYKVSSELPKEVRDKLFFIQHFRTPILNSMYKDLLKKYGSAFSNFSTGGLVSFSRIGINVPPYVMYIVPFIRVLDHAKKNGLKKFNFHVLGGSEWKEIICYKLFEKLIKELFDIEVNITYDSSSLFRVVCLGRYTFFSDEKNRRIGKLSLRSELLDKYKPNEKSNIFFDKTNYEMFCDLFNESVEGYDIGKLDPNKDYAYEYEMEESEDAINDSTDDVFLNIAERDVKMKTPLSKLIYICSIFQLFHLFKKVEQWCVEDSEKFYKEFITLDRNNFSNSLLEDLDKLMFMLTGGERVSDSLIRFRSLSLFNSLVMLKEYKKNPKDILDKCDYLIKEYMQKDEVF